jgi:hypothetical protein
MRLLFLTIAGMILAETALAEPATDSSRNEFTAKLISSCTARYKLGYDTKGKRYDPPFTEEEISNFCGCMGSTYADILTKEEIALALSLMNEPNPSRTWMPADAAQVKAMQSLMEKAKCTAQERCNKHLNLAHPELAQHEQCWKG